MTKNVDQAAGRQAVAAYCAANADDLATVVRAFVDCRLCGVGTGTICAAHRRDLRAALAKVEVQP